RFYVAENDGRSGSGLSLIPVIEHLSKSKITLVHPLSGYVRYGRVPNTQDAEVAIAVSPANRRHGLGLRMLQETESQAAKDLGITRLVALVLVGNEPSSRL